MEDQVIKQFTLNFREITIDEIALDGLQGISVDLLWRRIEHRISTNLTPKLKERLWKTISNENSLSFYKLPEPRDRLEILDRFRFIDEVSGHLRDHTEYLDGPYEFFPVPEAYGSCEYYSTRVFLSKDELQKLSLEEVVAKYGDSLVIVASLEERWHALASHVAISQLKTLSKTHFCLLELVGRARENGQMSIGKTNLFKIFKDSKIQYYFRKALQKLDLIRTSSVMFVCGNRGSNGILLRLKRFHRPKMANTPKQGAIYDTIEYLKTKPNFCASAEEVMKKILSIRSQFKRLKKTNNIFIFDDKPVVKEESEPAAKKRKVSHNQKFVKYISLITESEEEASDDETSGNNAPPVKCQFNVGINIFRQAYERLLEAGLKGLTQIEISEILGLEFYVTRTICRIFKSRNIVREILEDQGRQRTARYIAIAATSEIDKKFADEKKKLIDILNESSLITECQSVLPISEEPQASTSSDEPPPKIAKLDDGNRFKEADGIREVTAIEDQDNFVGFSKLLNSKKTPTMRHLKYANGILKVTREKLAVTGFVNLSHLVAKEIGETPMDTKAVDTLVKRLFTDGLLKLFKLKWPGHAERYSNVICAPHVKPTDHVIKALYKEICVRSISNKKAKTSKKEHSDPLQDKPFTMFAYPRYMKLRKLHEFIINLVYFEEQTPFTDLTTGFASLVHIIPEMPVELALCNITMQSIKEVMSLKINDKLIKLKLKEAPLNVYKLLLQSKSLLASLRANLAMMATFGLIQLCHKLVVVDHHSGALQYVFYVNRNARLLNTSGTWPRANVDEKALEKRFRFDKLEDVKSYWDSMFQIAVNTVVVDRTKGQPLPIAPIRHLGEVTDYDNGEIIGNGRGACGLDSGYYIEMQRHWESLRMINYRKTTTSTHKLKKTKKIQKESQTQTKSTKKTKRPEKKKLAPVKMVTAAKRKRLPDFALKWTKKEDKIIMLCKAAMNIMSPSSQPGCLTVRNLMAKDILSIYDPKKTASFCHRRAKSLESNSTLSHERECLINELKRRPHIISKYEGLLKKIRLSNSLNMAKYINDARLSGMELLWLLFQVSQSECYNRVMPCVAMDLNEFNMNYSITPSTSNKPFNLYQQSPDFDITVSTLKEAIIMTLTFRNDADISVQEKIYYFLEKYDEKSLRIAIDHLRKCGAICIREKFLNNVLNRFTFQDIVKTSSSYKATMMTYKLSAAYQRRLLSKLNSEFVDKISEHMTNELAKNPLPSSHMNCVLLELQACGELDIGNEMIPYVTGSHATMLRQNLNAIDIDAHYKLKLGTLKCVRKSKIILSDAYSCSDYGHIIQSLISDATIYPANVNYPVGDKVIEILSERRENGALFRELKEICGFDTKTLIAKLETMEKEHLVKRVGFQENLIVLSEFSEKWSLSNLDEHRIIPTPWLTLEDKINVIQFLKWCGVVLNRIYDFPGISMSLISDYSDYLTSRASQDICIFLAQTKCIKLKVITHQEPDLFSDEYLEPEEEEYYKYASTKSILAIPVKDSFIRFACVKKFILPE